jgi:ubiquinone/menaquinone biosynthesis C-methylase UbiE
MTDATPYIMESASEAARLEQKTDPVAAEEQLRWAGLRRGMRALDVGCGTGAVTRVMAAMASPPPPIGVDRSRERVAQARALARNAEVEFVEADATALPFRDASFDFVWSRFLFEYLPDPPAALAEMMRVAHPGGSVVVADLDGQIEQFWPLSPSLQERVHECLAVLRETGFDPHAGRKLYSSFISAGLENVDVHAMPYVVYAGGVPDRELDNWRIKAQTISRLLAERTGDSDSWNAFAEDFLAAIQRPETFYHCTLVIVHGTVPA